MGATPESHVDHAAMKEAVTAMATVVSQLNERKRAVENEDRLRVLQGAIDFSPFGEVCRVRISCMPQTGH